MNYAQGRVPEELESLFRRLKLTSPTIPPRKMFSVLQVMHYSCVTDCPPLLTKHFFRKEYHTFLKPTNAHFLFIVQYNSFTVKSVQHVSYQYSGTIIRDPYRESHKITTQQIMVHIKSSKDKM
jgi:hypothetical protein